MSQRRLVVFSTPKPFTGAISALQQNAINSWQRLGPDVTVILVGEEVGTAQVAQQLGVRYIPTVERNALGTPLLSSVVREATAASDATLFCYVNADIILLSDFVRAIGRVPFQRFLLSGRRWNAPVTDVIDFDAPDWEADMRDLAERRGTVGAPSQMDYFVFPRGLLDDLPDFAVGRLYWDTWIIFHARARRVPVVDASASILAIHQDHDYAHVAGGATALWTGSEARRNRELAEEMLFPFTLEDATWQLTASGLGRAPAWRRLPRRAQAHAALALRRHAAARRSLRRLLQAKFV
jgi:hypothetical protein